MNFTDPFFLFYFLPAFFLIVRVLTDGSHFTVALRVFIIIATLLFYGFENPAWIALFLAIMIPTFLCARLISRSSSKTLRVFFLVLGITNALLLLAVFKYLNWISDLLPFLTPARVTVARYFGKAGRIELPPGISFYVFEVISFMVDIFRRKISFPAMPLDFWNFSCFFPRFIAGPIVRYMDVADQLTSWPGLRLSRGFSFFCMGFCLKVLFADQFAKFTGYAFEVVHPDLLQAAVGSVSYGFQLYFDFWGYSIMATGLGYCLGFQFPDNFLMPYRAKSITDFWRRWHITLSFWLRDYLYISLGGNRTGKLRQYLNLFITMALGGLWHGASIVFILWGCWHGCLLIVERIIGVARIENLPFSLARLYALSAILIGWVLFRSSNLSQALDIVGGLFGAHGVATTFNAVFLEGHLFSGLMISLALLFWVFLEPKVFKDGGILDLRLSFFGELAVLLAFVFAMVVRLSEDAVPFLYFQF